MLDNGVYKTDWHEAIGMISDVQLFFTSPPYEDMITYRDANNQEVAGKIKGDDFIKIYWIELFEFFESAITDDGVVCIVIDDKVRNGSLSLVNYEGVIHVCKKMGWKFIDHVPWLKTQGTPKKGVRLQNWWEHIYIFSRSNKPKMYADRIRGKYSEETVKRYSNNMRKISSGTNRLLSRGEENTLKHTDVNNEHHRKVELHDDGKLMPNILVVPPDLRTGKKHPARFPPGLPEFGIVLCTDEGDTVCDPMCGSGTTVCEAKRLRRKYIGFDLSGDYVEMTERELRKTLVQESFIKDESLAIPVVGDSVQGSLF